VSELNNVVHIERTIGASPSEVWAVLADFPNIADWNGGVTASHSTSDAAAGVGARRHCDLAPMGALEETVLEWDDGRKMVISIDSAKKLPIKQARMTFLVDDADDGNGTDFTLHYEYAANGGPLARLVGKGLHGQLRKGFGGFVDDLTTAATARAD
jgi:uncharacterized protein YndB with AHSA1/START domain